ncbi:MAG: DUF3114 domain-containing protein [Lachnospiraceae bacterium]|nr:DUF3114 domain-containing protein [Lachnospiraceae bacterium]
MGESFYLNPSVTKEYCNRACTSLEAMNSEYESMKKTINNSEVFNMSGQAIDSIKSHMNIYLCAIQKYIDANNADISDFKTLSGTLGFETLDSSAIDWARSILDKENAWLSNSINSNNSAIRKLSKKDNARRAFYDAANKAANTQLNLNNKLIKLLDNKREEYHRIDNSTRLLFQNGAFHRWIADIYMSQLNGAYYDSVSGKYIYPNKNGNKSILDAMRFLKRPANMSDEKWQRYYDQVLADMSTLQSRGWNYSSLCAFIDSVNNMDRRNKSDMATLDEIMSETSEVGSQTFLKMWYSWPAISQDSAEQKLRVFYDMIGMGAIEQAPDKSSYIVGNQSLDEMLSQFSKDLDPNNAFWADYAALVRTAAPNGLITGDGIDTDFYMNIHQFRYVIDAQQVEYIRYEYKDVGKTDEDKLVAYIKKNNLKQGDDWDFDSARLHNKINGSSLYDSSYPGGKFNVNYKVLISNAFNSEFIMDSSGNFVYVLDDTKGIVENSNSIVNGASFNYACENDYKSDKSEETQHGKYDVDAGTNYDPKFREKSMGRFEVLYNDKSKDDNPKYKKSVIYDSVEEMQDEFENKIH